MSRRYPGGVVSATAPTVTAAGASGLYGLTEQTQYQGGNKWPPFKIGNSLRFRSAASAFLSRTPSVTGNRQTFTWSGWVKRGSLGVGFLFSANSTSPFFDFFFNSGNQLRVFNYNGSSYDFDLTTNAVFRDPSAWYHIVLAVDTTQATSSNRVILYVNNVSQSFTTSSYPSQNLNTATNLNVVHNIAREAQTTGNYIDGFIAENYLIDGQALTPSSFGGTDKNGVWSPIAYTGPYGSNGFYLPFNETTSATTLGSDKSGNNNNWTLSGFNVSTANATYDIISDAPVDQQSGDVNRPVGNYCTMNHLDNFYSAGTFADGNLKYTTGSSEYSYVRGTMGVSSGKWYWEATIGASSSANAWWDLGWSGRASTATTNGLGNNADDIGYLGQNGAIRRNVSEVSSGTTYTTGDVIGVMLDLDNNLAYFSKNGTIINSGTGYSIPAASATATGFYYPAVGDFDNAGTKTYTVNFGQQPFAYTPPSGFKSLCTTNLPDPTIKQPNQHFDISLYTGNGSSQNITNSGSFSPAMLWIKERSSSSSHRLVDVVRGSSNLLVPNSTTEESSDATAITAFNSNGFSVGNNLTTNESSVTYVGWQWNAGSSTVTNTSGTISSQVRANPTAGFSIVTYTGTGANATVGHGLGVAPKMVIVKCRTQTRSWPIYHTGVGNTGFVQLQTTTQALFTPNLWNNTTPTSTVFSLGSDPETNGAQNYVAYCFAEIEGYSKIGSYTGNGSTDGPFVYCGFRPKWILFKNASAGSTDWKLFDSSRNTSNIVTSVLYPNLNNAEETNTGLDFVSNGFKWRDNGSAQNGSGNTILFAAFAENPFKYSRAR